VVLVASATAARSAAVEVDAAEDDDPRLALLVM